MVREIKFRAKRLDNGGWIYGDLHLRTPHAHIHSEVGSKAFIDTDTVGQFTGLLDKNGKEIYEGDIIRYADIDEYVVNPDCDLHLHFSQSYVKVIEDVVIFANGAFSLSDDIYPRPISVYGIKDIKDLRDWLGIKDDEDTDCNGTIINESLLGIEIVGNICENFGIVK